MNPTETILVTGATGNIGRFVVDELLRAGAPVRALTRDPEAAQLPAGVSSIKGDFTAPEWVDAALHDADTVFLVWTSDVATAPAVVDLIARRCRRVVYLSAPFRTPHPFFQQPNPMRDMHAEVERLLSETDLDVAILRPGMFASNVIHWWAPQIREGDVVRWPYADASTAPVDERDIGAVGARVLLDPQYAREDVVLTGSESLTQRQQVEIIGEAIGRPLRLDEITPDDFRRTTGAAWPPAIADMLLSAWSAAVGQPAFVTADVHRILGRSPRTFREWAEDHEPVFAKPIR